MLRLVLVTTVCLGILTINGCTAKGVWKNGETDWCTAKRAPEGYFLPHNIPKADEGCMLEFRCKKKLQIGENPKPCVKYCVETVVCENDKRTPAPPGQCVELNVPMVIQEYNECNYDGNDSNPIMSVDMMKFPCRPGFVLSSRGICREVL